MTRDIAPETAALPARERILRTAHDLFYLEGIRATGIDRVIAESGVTKVTLYRHFPSKNELILAFLKYRHERWMTWFDAALLRHGAQHADAKALVPALAEWFAHPHYRGCAFINAVAEIGPALPEAVVCARRHKQELAERIAALLPADAPQRELRARALAQAVDGAIVRAASETDPGPALEALAFSVRTLSPSQP
ncbi:TetR/AcrR family transcriptional regulator [Lysobacter firmicutimachus]|uniref:TetR/AcrR family transcriptional regulator n=1 Tax=Lysobacter firmicutimachus TaxID=1792846 RepID=A0AAU8MUB9_9GAMM